MNKTHKSKLLIISCFAALSLPAYSATLVVSVQNADTTTPYDLTNEWGTLDWAYTSGGNINRKDGGSLIGTMPSSLGSAGQTPGYGFTFADGESPETGTITNPTFANEQSITVTVTAPSANPFTIYYWGSVFQATGTLTATISGDSATDSASYTLTGSTRSPGALFTIVVDPNEMGDVVTLTYVMSDPTASNQAFSTVAFTAIGVVPEPTTALLGGLGFLMLLRRRR